MKCINCEGRGYVFGHKNCDHNAEEAYILGCYDQRVCYVCLGTGSKGAKLIAAVLLEIKLESTDPKSRILAEKGLAEMMEEKKHKPGWQASRSTNVR
jgi:hypothetical protein